MGFTQPTPIQEKIIPLMLQGSDVIGQAKTGTGKTAAFGIPIVQVLCEKKVHGKIVALVVTPTRELAMQVCAELSEIGEFAGVHAVPVYGGQEI